MFRPETNPGLEISHQNWESWRSSDGISLVVPRGFNSTLEQHGGYEILIGGVPLRECPRTVSILIAQTNSPVPHQLKRTKHEVKNHILVDGCR